MLPDRAYISGPLMAARDLDELKSLYLFISDVCYENGIHSYLPHTNTDPVKDSHVSDDEVFRKDYNEMINSSLVISYVGEPSLGVGAELCLCSIKNIPVITIYKTGQKVSRFLKGMLKTSSNNFSIEYESREDLKQKLSFYIKCHRGSLSVYHTSSNSCLPINFPIDLIHRQPITSHCW